MLLRVATGVSILTQLLGVVPVLWVLWLRRQGHRIPEPWWWMATGLGVSFFADFAPHGEAHQVYPVAQALLFAYPMLTEQTFVRFGAAVIAAAAASVVWRDAAGLDVLLRTVAHGGLAGIVLVGLPGRKIHLRLMLGGAWCLLLVTWWVFTRTETFPALWAMQGARAVLTGLWCWAAWDATRRDAGPA